RAWSGSPDSDAGGQGLHARRPGRVDLAQALSSPAGGQVRRPRRTPTAVLPGGVAAGAEPPDHGVRRGLRAPPADEPGRLHGPLNASLVDLLRKPVSPALTLSREGK